MSNIKLYLFESGSLSSQKHLFTFGRGVGEPFTVPVPFFLIDHPKGKLLFDTGNAIETASDPYGHWGSVADTYYPHMRPEEFVTEQLKSMDVQTEDIAFVILSHLHLDHAGGVGHFPNARYVVQRDELHWAYVPDFYQKGAYIRADFDKEVSWLILEGERDDKYDLFGDGTLELWFTPGHTPGHQSLLLNLPNTGPVLLAADSCYTEEILEENVLPGLVWSPPHAVKSIEKLRRARDVQNIQVWTGHDPQAWQKLRKAPAYYD